MAVHNFFAESHHLLRTIAQHNWAVAMKSALPLTVPLSTLALLVAGPHPALSFAFVIVERPSRAHLSNYPPSRGTHALAGPAMADTRSYSSRSLVVIGSQSEEKADVELSSESGEDDDEEELTEADWALCDKLLASDEMSSDALESRLAAALPTMHPRLVMRLRTAAEIADEDEENSKEERVSDLRTLGKALTAVLDHRLRGGRDLLEELLKTGEVRKLDGAIGKASREGGLDMGFFTVLNMNIRDAQYEASQLSEEERAKLAEISVPTDEDSGVADRLQILQHIYTRCQEELEKSVNPGAGLLNKLLRTEDTSIRSNQLRHYLGPQANMVVTPDGKEVPLQGEKKALVPPTDLIDAMATAVKQIRTVEKAGGTDKATAAGLVESCRQVAIEARIAIGEVYGMDSEELKDFESGLQPVFRPSSATSEYMTGE